MGSTALKIAANEAEETEESTLTTLVKKAQDGDRQAQAQLIEESKDRLFRFCVYLTGNQQLAADLSQDTFVKAIGALGKLKEPNRFTSWLMTMAKNLYIDHVRSPKNKYHSEYDESTHEKSSDPKAQLSLEIQKVLNQMDPEDRMLILLVDLEENSYAEAAEIVGSTEAAVRSRLHRARKKFAELYSK